MEFRKMVTMTLYVRQHKRYRCKEQTFGLWEKARVGENSTEACVLSYVKQITSPGSMHDTGCSGLGCSPTGMTRRGGMGSEVGGGFRMVGTCTLMADSYQSMAKTTTIL